MKIKNGFVLREIAGLNVVTAESIELLDYNKLLSFNATATYLWKEVLDKEFDENMLAGLLVDKYGIDLQVAISDVQKLLKSWSDAGLLEDSQVERK